MNSDYLPDALSGYFRLGTLINYLATEQTSIRRLSDPTESRRQDSYTTPTGCTRQTNVLGTKISNHHSIGYQRDLLVETVVNEFCSCSSIGPYKRARLKRIKRNGNADIDAWVTYDTQKLMSALERILSERLGEQVLAIGRPVRYGDKDTSSMVGDTYSVSAPDDAMGAWINTAFVKLPAFAHEDEFRILLVKPDGLNSLREDTATIEITEPSIQDSIFSHTPFSPKEDTTKT